MAFPTTITGTRFPEQINWGGPFISSAGNVYLFLIAVTDQTLIQVWRATDPTDSFAESDSSNRPALSDNVESMWCFQVADIIHIAHQEVDSGRTAYSTFDMAGASEAGAWGTVDLLIDNPQDAPSQQGEGCSIAVRSDGDVIVLYNGDGDKDMGVAFDRVDYGRKENGTFANVGISVGGTSPVTEVWRGPSVVLGSSDRMHFFFTNGTLNKAYSRTLNSANSLESLPSPSDDASADHAFLHGFSYNDGGTQRVRCPYRGNAGAVIYAEFDSVDSPGGFTPNTITSLNVRPNHSSYGVNGLVDGTDEYMVWCDTNGDVSKDKNDTTDVVITSVRSNLYVYANIFVRQGATVIAYVTDIVSGESGTTIQYDEDVIVAASGGDTKTATADAILKSIGETAETTADAILKASITIEVTADAILKPVPKVSTADAILKASLTKDTTADAVLVSSLTQEQEGYRWRNDDGTETSATWIQAQDVDITKNKEINVRLRILTDNTGNPDTQQIGLEYRKVGDPDTEWRLVP